MTFKGADMLNAGQQKAVSITNGPLLVVAGAGTGKTRVIVEKISRLLDSGVKPESILAVTFTEKAAAEMLDRILLNRSGLLLDMPIMTYNGYGESLLREFGVHIGLPRNFRLLTPNALVVFVRERIDQFKLDYFMPLTASPDGIIEDLLDFFSRLRQHLITPEVYKKYADSLPAGNPEESAEKQQSQELAAAYSTYTKIKKAEAVIDYDDQIYLAIQLLQQRPNIRQILNNRYHTVFVDEFQDTNPMQSRLIDLIVPTNQNITVVGDDDQAIYGFRGATLNNILSFKTRYPKAQQVALTKNYRSHQAILDAAYNLIQHNNPNRLEATLGLNKRLASDQKGAKPSLHKFTTKQAELTWLAQDITKRLKKLKPSQPVSIAILTRSNPSAQAVHQALQQADVPHRVVGLNPDLYTQPVVRMLIELTRTITEPNNNASLHHTLISDLFGLSNNLVAPYATSARYEHELLTDKLADVADAKKALQFIEQLRASAASESVGRLLWRAIDETGYKDKLLQRAQNDETAAASIGHLSQFFDTLKQFESIAIQPTAAQYVLSLPALQAAGQSTSDGTLDLSESEVIVTTVHKAKGLEWDTVYLPRLTNGSFPMNKQGGGINLPDALVASTASEADEHYAEERRVMYVAVTRARHNLLLSFAAGPRSKPSIFINEMFGPGTAEAVAAADTANTSVELPTPVAPIANVSIPSTIYDGQTVTIDVSRAVALLNCPLNFYYKFILHTPEAPTVSTAYGLQMHSLIEEINTNKLNGAPLRPLKTMLADLKNGWQKAGYASKSQQERAFKKATQTLTNYYSWAGDNPAPIAVEKKFRAALTNNVTLYGKIDAVYGDASGIEIRDYKTGDAAQTQDKANKKAGASTQLELYALAWLTEHGEMPAKLSLHYVDHGLIGKVAKQQKTVQKRGEQLLAVIQNMLSGVFPPGNQHEYCLHPPLDEV